MSEDHVHCPFIFRKVDGRWQRRHREGGHWFTLKVVTEQRTTLWERNDGRADRERVLKPHNVWMWV